MPPYVKQFVYRRFAEILKGEDTTGTYDFLVEEDRKAVLEILLATKPEFAAQFTRSSGKS
jgi:hypothetical protein